MSTFVVANGTLYRGPERRVSSKGKTYARCTLRVAAGDGAQWRDLIAFRPEIVAEPLILREGDALAATGPMMASLYEGRQGARLSLTLIVEQVIPSCRRRQRKGAEAAASPERPFDDEVRL